MVWTFQTPSLILSHFTYLTFIFFHLLWHIICQTCLFSPSIYATRSFCGEGVDPIQVCSSNIQLLFFSLPSSYSVTPNTFKLHIFINQSFPSFHSSAIPFATYHSFPLISWTSSFLDNRFYKIWNNQSSSKSAFHTFTIIHVKAPPHLWWSVWELPTWLPMTAMYGKVGRDTVTLPVALPTSPYSIWQS